jgi:hypothetical protein
MGREISGGIPQRSSEGLFGIERREPQRRCRVNHDRSCPSKGVAAAEASTLSTLHRDGAAPLGGAWLA